MNKKSKNLCIVLVITLIVSGSLLGVSYAQSGSGDGRFQTVKIDKSQNLTESWQGKITVRVVGMQNDDAVNIRLTSDAKLNAKVLTVAEKEITFSGENKLRIPKSGEAIPETALNISNSEINFTRPQIEGKVLIDIELPESTQVDLFYNDEQVVKNSALYSPIVIRNGIVGKGEDGIGKALTKVMFPQLQNHQPGTVKEIGENKFHVPFSKLQVKQSDELSGSSASIKAVIEINEQGLVEKVAVMEPINSPEIEQNIRQWRFVPYKKDGVAVKVTTFFIKE